MEGPENREWTRMGGGIGIFTEANEENEAAAAEGEAGGWNVSRGKF